MSREIRGARLGPVYFAILITVVSPLPTIAIGENLSIRVVDDSKHGVSSVIYQGGAAEVIIGTTKQDGTLLVPSYKCGYDKPLLAKPIDASYFNSNQEPCKTPLRFLVHSRMTPNGKVAFNLILKDVKFPDGSDGQIDYKIAMNVDKHTVDITESNRKECKVDYNIDGYGSVSKLIADSWTKIGRPEELATNIFGFDDKTVSQLFQNRVVRAETTGRGIAIFVRGDCSDVTTTTTDAFANVIKEAVDQKVKRGEYRDLKDLIQFNEPK